MPVYKKKVNLGGWVSGPRRTSGRKAAPLATLGRGSAAGEFLCGNGEERVPAATPDLVGAGGRGSRAGRVETGEFVAREWIDWWAEGERSSVGFFVDLVAVCGPTAAMRREYPTK